MAFIGQINCAGGRVFGTLDNTHNASEKEKAVSQGLAEELSVRTPHIAPEIEGSNWVHDLRILAAIAPQAEVRSEEIQPEGPEAEPHSHRHASYLILTRHLVVPDDHAKLRV